MKTWITSDLHIGHWTDEKRNIIKYCNRPFKTIDEMNLTIQNNWNNLINEDDIVYNLGDYVFNGLKVDFHLNGKIILIKGNHDRFTQLKLKEKFCIDTMYKIPLKISYNGYDIKLMHSPIHKENGFINFCGHVHGLWKYQDGVYNVGIDVHEFKPILLDYAIEDSLKNKMNMD